MVGVDGSERLIELARERTRAAGLDVTYICANSSSMEEIGSESVDIVVAAMSLMDVEDYDGTVREIHRVLRPDGELLMSITHPCFSAPVSHWLRDERRQPLQFVVDRYFERLSWPSKIAERFRQEVVRRHRPLEDYMRAPIESGFVLREFSEPAPTAEEMRLSPRFEKLRRIPYFLFMRWLKTAS